ncbi:MAG: YrhB domain-containing protein [Woeseiaceae bacterium]|nr:YrhB domain-containing protein [Woeseiaceae bacterium]
MITKTDAQRLVEKELSGKGSNEDWQVIEDSTLEYAWGWVFFYQSRKYLETGDFQDQLAGNAPHIVNRNTAEIRVTGTARDIDYYVREYEVEIGERD